MRRKLLVAAIIGVAVITIALAAVVTVRKGGASYSSFSRAYWNEVYPLTFDISPSGNTIVFTAHGNGGRDLYIFDIQTKRIKPLTYSTQFEAEVRFLDNNMVIASAVEYPEDVSSSQYLYLVNVGNGTRHRLTADSRMRDSTIVPLSSEQVVFGRGEIRKQFNPVWGFVVRPWGFIDVFSVHVGDYLINPQTGGLKQVHQESTWIYLDEVGAVFSDRQRVIQLISRGMTDDMFLTRLSAPLGSLKIRAMGRKRIARNASCPVLSEDEQFVYYVTGEPSGAYSIVRLGLRSLKTNYLARRNQKIICMRRANQWLFFLEGSGNNVTLWRMGTHGKRLEKLLSPAQFADPLGQ